MTVKKDNYDGDFVTLPSIFSENIAKGFSRTLPKEHKKELGQFFTPLCIASFMADMYDVDLSKKKLSILDPGCGTLTLTCSIVERILNANTNIEDLEIDVYDIDASLSSAIEKISSRLIDWGERKGVHIAINFILADFLLRNESLSINDNQQKKYDLIVSNPPYFKIGKEDQRLLNQNKDIKLKGQQNIYSLFILYAIKSLASNGQMIFIVPRSFTSGLYFQSFREIILSKIAFEHFHVFQSRNDGFKNDGVLQENIIFKASLLKHSEYNIRISSSFGLNDINQVPYREFPKEQIIKRHGKFDIIHLPVNTAEENAIQIFSTWKHNLHSFGMKVSTGPVIPFRCKSYLKEINSKNDKCVPLYWMHNCSKMTLDRHTKKRKEAWIIDNTNTNSKTILNNNYIILRRFSSKDDRSKLVAAPHIEKEFSFHRLGIENHLNYLYRPDGNLSIHEVYGLSVLFNSKLFDSFYRSLCGNTQVSATELNSLPLPSIDIITELGEKYMMIRNKKVDYIDELVNFTLNIKVESNG